MSKLSKLFISLIAVSLLGLAAAPTANAYFSAYHLDGEVVTLPSKSGEFAPQSAKAHIVSRHEVKLSWSKPKTLVKNGKVQYHIYRAIKTNYASTNYWISHWVGETTSTSFNLEGVTAENNYYFIRASHQKLSPTATIAKSKIYSSNLIQVNTSPKSQLLKPSTSAARTDKKKPNSVRNLYAVADAHDIEFNWKGTTDDKNGKGVLGYRVYRVVNGIAKVVGEVKHRGTNSTHSFAISGIEFSPRHAFYVKTVDKAGNTTAVPSTSQLLYVNSDISGRQYQ